jgi:SAM-dependent methyltransferase
MNSYVLGHAGAEVQRLLLQGRIYSGHTEHALRVAGLRPGMRVLDVGCGPGDVSFVASRLVGPTGTVLAVDAAADIIEFARTRAAELGESTVRFEQSALADIALDVPVDAVIGRLILVHLPDPVDALRHLATQVRPGGFIAFSEPDMTPTGSIPDLPLCRAVKNGIADTFTRMGVDPAFGVKLHTVFQQAGLRAPQLTLGAPLGGADATEILACVVETWRSVFSMAEHLGKITDELSDLDTLLPRLRDEVANADAVVILPALVTAWARV